jgi:hypothetical protein
LDSSWTLLAFQTLENCFFLLRARSGLLIAIG